MAPALLVLALLAAALAAAYYLGFCALRPELTCASRGVAARILRHVPSLRERYWPPLLLTSGVRSARAVRERAVAGWSLHACRGLTFAFPRAHAAPADLCRRAAALVAARELPARAARRARHQARKL
jgi:hypothetical protein